MNDTELIKQFIREHRGAAARFRSCCTDDTTAENFLELIEQARDCDYIDSWLEELLLLRNRTTNA